MSSAASPQPKPQVPESVHRFAFFLAGCIVLLLMAGALVTSNDAGLAVPDWPLSYGSLLPPMVGGIFYEHGHRMIATAVGILTIVLAIMLARSEPRRWVRNLGWTALALVVAQGILGGLTVKLLLPPPISTAHATLAQLFFVTIVSITLFTSKWWQSDLQKLDDAGSPPLRTLAAVTSAAIFVQLILGAAFRHAAFGILPHLIGAVVVFALVIATGRTVRKRFGQVRDLRKWGILLQSFLGVQILLGLAAYWAVAKAIHEAQPSTPYITLTVAHVLGGALTLAASVVLTLSCFRLIRDNATVAVAMDAPVSSTTQGSKA
ncbi:MAG TPA: COX15/CtaA family protein [Candidatus Acidoferrales bacterium]